MVLQEKSTDNSTKRETREKAGRILKHWKTQQWMLINLGLIDIFALLGSISKSLQKVEQFPWQISRTQGDLIKTLRKVADIQLANEAGDMFEGHFDKNLWVRLNADIEKVLSGKYKVQDTSKCLAESSMVPLS